MKQLIQNFKNGELYVDDVPAPTLTENMVLVENAFSLISAGTEKSTVDVGKASMLGKAKKRPDLVKQVMNNVRKEGLLSTYKKVMTKLDSLKALGYSTAGTVLASMDGKGKFKEGDRVACAGQDYASHASVVSVPTNLVARIPDNVSFEEAAFTTLGAIAMQGVRQAEPQLGHNVCVIGLGLLGQITCQLLKANGCRVFGVDVDQKMVEVAKKTSCENTINRQDESINSVLENFTHGYGFDSVIITAGTTSNDPVEFASDILRKKGKVIIVGAVGMNIPRNPHFYRKELDLRMSCSYGPGRYDREYEEKGNDYPFGYVRWTEGRNMQSFLELISQGKIDLKPLITHIFDIDEAPKAYDMITGKIQEDYIGILIKYPHEEKAMISDEIELSSTSLNEINVGFIGAGSFAQSYLLPHIKGKDINLDTVVTRTGINSKNVAKKFGFSKSSTDVENIFKNDDINTVYIATQHDTHGSYSLNALKNGKNVFVEKPVTIDKEELEELNEYLKDNKQSRILVGFNRRFSTVAKECKKVMKYTGEPLVMNFRVNAGHIPKDHWTQDSEKGGGRILGEVCHFVDLMHYFTASKAVKVYAESIVSDNSKINTEDNIIITIKFKDGSIGTIVYNANGDKSLPKERFEIFSGGKVFVIEDFKKGILYSDGNTKEFKCDGKGHREEMELFLKSIREGKPSPISWSSIYYTTLTTFKIKDSLATGLPQDI